MDVAHFTAKALREKGVRYVFGIPGGPSIPYMEAWREAGIEFILTSGEAAAGIMADVTARVTGTPGVCHATFGPGAVNLASGAGCALLDRSSLIAFTTELPVSMAGRTTQMGINHQELFKPVTKATFRLSPEKCSAQLERAFAIAAEEYPGSVHIGLPSDISGMEVSELSGDDMKRAGEAGVEQDFQSGSTDASATISDSDLYNSVIKLLSSAKRPLFAVGLTAARCGVSELLLKLLAMSPVPVVLTPMAKGVIPSDHRCNAGVLFHALSDRLKQVTAESDLVIGIGYDQVEYNYESWMPAVPLVHFGTVLTDMPGNMSVVQVPGEAGIWFRLLEKGLGRRDYLTGRNVDRSRNEISEVFDQCSAKWGPVAVMKELRDNAPAGTVLTCDVGSHLHMAGQYWPADTPGQFVITNGWSTMGFGIPSALAVKLNRPGTAVFCVTGDGGFLMSAGEMMTARRYKLNIKVVVISDRELNLIKVKQSWKKLNSYATTIVDGEMFGADMFLGVKVFHATDSASMKEAIESAMLIDEPVIINAIVPGDDYSRLIVRQ
jgi:acetolactate synthase I/II/III large subunit